MNILLAFNADYYIGAIVLLCSILEHNDWCDQITIYVLYSELPLEKQKRFSQVASERGHASVVYIRVGAEEFSDAPIFWKWISRETYYRLLAQELLPQSVDRILYLDADLIVRKSLQEFYQQDFEGKLLVACNRRKAGQIEPKRLEQLTLPPDAIYFNAGVLLYNLKEQREQLDSSVYREYLTLFSKWLTYQDQDVLNAVFYGLTKYADYRFYNVFDFDILNEEKRERALRRSVIFHYNGRGKPWNVNYWGRMADVFWEYAEKLPEYQGQYAALKLKQQAYKKTHAIEAARAARKKKRRGK